MLFNSSETDFGKLDKTNQIRRFRKNAKALIEYICEYRNNVSEKPIFPDVEPGYLRPLLPRNAKLNYHIINYLKQLVITLK